MMQVDVVANAFLEQDALLQPVRQAMKLMGAMVVPGSSLIVGARLYAYWNQNSAQTDTHGVKTKNPSSLTSLSSLSSSSSPSSVSSSKRQAVTLRNGGGEGTLQARQVVILVATRYVVLPVIGRVLVRLVDGWLGGIQDDLLRMYMTVPFFMPTASNSVVMVQMAAQRDLSGGLRMERALLTVMFWQYAVAPVFLTANVLLGLVDLEAEYI